MAADIDMQGAGELLAAWQFGGDVEAVLDRIDTREAASGLASILAFLVGMSGMPTDVFLGAVKTAVIGEHMRRATSGAVKRR